MSGTLAVVFLVVSLLILFGTAIAVSIILSKQKKVLEELPRALDEHIHPCYRCGVDAVTEYMGLHYCLICRDVVTSVIGAVREDPPFGFPGSSGYLEPVVLNEKKEEKKEE